MFFLNRKGQRSLVLILLMVSLSLILGAGWTQAMQTPPVLPLAQASPGFSEASVSLGTIDPVPDRYKLGQEIYLENCATCHVGLPPQTMPSETWRRLLLDSQHYGVTLKPLVDPPRLLVWGYLQTFSRLQIEDEETPYRIGESRFFKALHPNLKLPRPLKLGSCVTCHPGAQQYNYRSLTPEWQNSP